ncbi:MAG: hypothetical protein Q9162_003278 [Coniocarpon cinnabarinum]
MSDAGILQPKVFRHPLGLPGKAIKLVGPDGLRAGQEANTTTPQSTRDASERRRREKSPLGISFDSQSALDTNGLPKTSSDQVSESHPAIGSPRGRHNGPLTSAHGLSDHNSSPAHGRIIDKLSNKQGSKGGDSSACDGIDQSQASDIDTLKAPVIILDSSENVTREMADPPRQRRLPRPTSSVYTHAAPISHESTPAAKVRKFPRLNLVSIPPIAHLAMPFGSIKTPVSTRTPPSSTSAAFDDDSSTSSKRPSPTSIDGRRASIDTVPATPRRSKGWWNLILSPVEGKKMTLHTSPRGRAYTTDPDAPEVPVLDHAAAMGEAETRNMGGGQSGALSSPLSGRAVSGLSYVAGGAADEYYDFHVQYGDGARNSGSTIFEDYDRSSDIDEQPHEKSLQNNDAERRSVKARLSSTSSNHTSPDASPASTNISTKASDAASPVQKPRGCSPRNHSPNLGSKTPQSKSYFTWRTPTQATHEHEQKSASPKSAFDTLSPGVVEVADARPIQSARSIRTKSPQPPPPNSSQVNYDRPHTEEFFAHHNRQTTFYDSSKPPPLPQKPVLTEKLRPIPPNFVRAERNEQPRAAQHVENSPQPKLIGDVWPGSKSDTQVHQVDHRYRFEKPKRHRWVWTKERKFLALGAGVLFFILLLTLILALTLTQHHDDIPVAASWLNLTGYPAIPTGIVTIARPHAKSQGSCVVNPDIWSCALPKEQQQSVAPNGPDQPNFRLEIRYVGDSKTFVNSSSSPLTRRSWQRRSLLADTSTLVKRDSFSDLVTWASPASPSDDEQDFLGNTTDKILEPFAGETTPFTISLLPAGDSNTSSTSPAPPHRKRDDNSTAFQSFPPPAIAPNHTIAEAQLLPFPSNQPLKLYNRGNASEHYGFYTYFDRRIFMQLTNASDSTSNPVNAHGGSAREDANMQCTWSQTRLLVQIWTKSSPGHSVTPAAPQGNNKTASAMTFTSPGTFPLAVTITMDRHGGDARKKAIYCYGLDEDQRPSTDQKGIVGESRNYGGTAVNPAPAPFESGSAKGYGGTDGGSGGCSCQWQNFS